MIGDRYFIPVYGYTILEYVEGDGVYKLLTDELLKKVMAGTDQDQDIVPIHTKRTSEEETTKKAKLDEKVEGRSQIRKPGRRRRRNLTILSPLNLIMPYTIGSSSRSGSSPGANKTSKVVYPLPKTTGSPSGSSPGANTTSKRGGCRA